MCMHVYKWEGNIKENSTHSYYAIINLFRQRAMHHASSDGFVYRNIHHHHHHVTQISMDIIDPLSPHLSIVHCFRQVFRTTSCIGPELLYIGSSWSSCLCSAMWRGPQEYISYELVRTSTAMSCMSGSSILMVFVMGGKWPYSCCFVGYCLHDLFNIARSILV